MNGWFGVSNLQAVARNRRPCVLWEKQDYRAAMSKGRKVGYS